MDVINYVNEHGTVSGSAAIPVPFIPYTDININFSATREGYSWNIGVGPGVGAAFSFLTGTGWSWGHDPVGFTQTAYAMGGIYSKFGGEISGYHSSAGFGAEIDTGMVFGDAAGFQIGYTFPFRKW